MPVNTAKVQGRRSLNFATYDELLADAEKVAAGPTQTLGNWSTGQILSHLARTMHGAIDGIPMSFPWYTRALGKILRPLILRMPVPAGFKLPPEAAAALMPADDVSTEQGLAELKAAAARLRSESKRAVHPVFGRISPELWDQLQLKHANLHMSFLVPE